MKKDTILHRIAEGMELDIRTWSKKCSQPGKKLFPAWEKNVPSVGINNSPKAHFLRSLMLLLVMTMGVGNVWGQAVDLSGTYYIASGGRGENNNQNATNKYTYNPSTPSNNFYLCPTEGWCYYQDPDNFWPSNTEDDNKTMPFLTTFKCRTADYHSGNASDAVWIIKKAPDSDYYYIIQKSTGRYLVSNGQIETTNNPDRIRVHLQSFGSEEQLAAQGNKVLFEIVISSLSTTTSTYIEISPKGITDGTSTAHGDHDKHKWLTVNNGNYNYLTGQSGKTGGPTGYGNTCGIVCLYSKGDNNAPFCLEDVIARPTITYNSTSNQIDISAAQTGATLIYTTDGSVPSTSNGTEVNSNTTSFDRPSTTNVTTIKAVAKVGDDYSNVVTFNAYMPIGSENEYLMQTIDGGSFYMVPPITTETNVTTTNIPHEKMAWYLTDAGQTFGHQYYYIVNSNTTQFLYCSGAKAADNAFVMKAADATGIVPTRRRFMLVASEGGYNIIPEFFELEATGMCMNKNGNNATNYLNLSNGTDDHSRWTFVPKPSAPKTLFDNSFATVGTNYKTYKIQSAAVTNKYLVPSSMNLIASATATGDYSVWFLEDTGESDTWLSYYYLRNRTTGDYVYFDGTTDGGKNANTFFISTDITSGSEDKYKFIVVKAANVPSYNIIPKILKDKVNQAQNSLSNTMETLNSRGEPKTLWNLVEDNSFTVISPVITYESGVVSMSCATPGTTIKYTKGTTDPSTIYEDTNKPAFTDDDPIYIKAVAVADNQSSTISDIVTFIKNPDVNFADGFDFSYTGQAIEPAISSVTITPEGATTPITIDDSEYNIAYSDNTAVGKATITISDAITTNNTIISGITKFDIIQKSLGDGTAAADGITITITKTGENEYGVTVKHGEITLTPYNPVDPTAPYDYKVTGTPNESGFVAIVEAKKDENQEYTGNYSGGATAVYVKASFPTLTSDTDGGSAAVYQASIDLVAPPDLKAYIVTGIDYNAGTVIVQELTYIPKDEPILLLTNNDAAHEADFTATVMSGITDDQRNTDTTGNKLQKSEGTESVDWGQYYIFSKGEFVLSMGGKTMKAGKFFFENEKYVDGTTAPFPSRLFIVRGGTTKIEEIIDHTAFDAQPSNAWYTLDGQRLNKKPTQKGIYIQNGKKLIVK